MSQRSVRVQVSKGIEAALTNELIEQICIKTVDKAYDRNMTIDERKGEFFLNRYVIPCIDGKVAVGGAIAKALIDNPQSVGQLLPIVMLVEEKGEDVCYVNLQSEIEADPVLSADPKVRAFIDQPSVIANALDHFKNQ